MNGVGASWKGGKELKTIQRIVGDVDEIELPPRTHNQPPTTIFAVDADAIALEAQAIAVEKALEESQRADGIAESKRLRAARALVQLQNIFLLRQHKENEQMREQHKAGSSAKTIGESYGLSKAAVEYIIKNTQVPKPQGRGGHLFTAWAIKRFNISVGTLREYLCIGKGGHDALRRLRKKNVESAQKVNRKNRDLIRLVRAQERAKVTPDVFKGAFMALELPSRIQTFLWSCSIVIGSEDPQEIARWFAARMGDNHAA